MKHTITSKGQVTVPKVFRDRFGLGPGGHFAVNDRGELTLSAQNKTSLQDRLAAARAGLVQDGLTTDQYLTFVRGED
jgi:AbrB family looped-hinge helix DNA binding protein